MLNYVNVNDQSLLLIGCSNGTHESVSQSSQPAISPQPRLPHSIDVDSSQRMDTWGLPNKYYSNSSVTLFPMSFSSSFSHRRLNAFLKCDWDVIVSFDWPFVGRHFTELIPLHCRPLLLLVHWQSHRNDQRRVILLLPTTWHSSSLSVLPVTLYNLSDMSSVVPHSQWRTATQPHRSPSPTAWTFAWTPPWRTSSTFREASRWPRRTWRPTIRRWPIKVSSARFN